MVKTNTKGSILIFTLIFSATLFVVVLSLSGLQLAHLKVGQSTLSKEKAFVFAEAGLQYYKWFLNHFPDDTQDGTGQPGPYRHTYTDPESGEVGAFTLDITGKRYCGVLQYVDISSVGEDKNDTRFKRKLSARILRPTVAEYAFIINSNVWAGADRVIVGPYHSNGGIRMDGTNQSVVTSAVESWYCDSTFGCSPASTTPGIWGAGANSHLWKYPTPQVDFAGITVDLFEIKDIAQNQGGIFLPKFSGGSKTAGYHLVFDGNTVNVYKVTNTYYAWSIHIDDPTGNWYKDYHTIANETFVGSYTLDENCPVIFVEDQAWIEGRIQGKVTVAVADPETSFDPDIIIAGNITYTNEKQDGLTAIAENSVLIPLIVDSDLTIRGIFVAQKGYFGRNLYPCWYSPYDKRNSLSVLGTVVSNQRLGTKWSYSTWGCWGEWSGFSQRVGSYDRYLASSPPPFTPQLSNQYKIINWKEDEVY